MNRRNKNIIAGAAGVALVLGIGGTALAMNKDVEPEVSPVVAAAEATTVTPASLWNTTMQLPSNYTAFFVADEFQAVVDGQIIPVAEIDFEAEDSAFPYTEEQVFQIEQQLQAAPSYSVLFVDDRSVDEAGLTTALSTVTPSNGLTLGDTNNHMTEFMQGQFAEQVGTHGNLYVEGVPHASFTYSQGTEDSEGTEEVQWEVSEHLLQYGDAMVSVRFTTEGEHAAEFTNEFNSFLTTWTRG